MKKMLIAALLACGAVLAGCATYREPPSEAQLASVRRGMTVAEVEELLGPPDGGIERYANGETVASWRLPVRFEGIRHAFFNAHYRDGKVARTSRSYEYLSMP